MERVMSFRSKLNFFAAVTALLILGLPAVAQDAPLPVPYTGATPGIISRAPFEVPSDLLPQTRAPISLTVTMFNDPAVGACDTNNGVSLREALVNCSGPAIQPVVYLPPGTYVLSSSLVVSDRSFTVIGHSPLTTFIEASPANIRLFDIGLLGTHTATFANLTVRNSTGGSSGNAMRFAGSGSVRLENMRITGNTGTVRGTLRFDVETSSTLSVSITNSEISGNTGGAGAGIAFTNELGSGIGALNIANSLISDNTAANSGGGLLVTSIGAITTQVTIFNSTIQGNSGLNGGGISVEAAGANLVIQDSSINGNTLSGVVSGTGAGLEVAAVQQVLIDGSVFDGNDAGVGTAGAMYFTTNVGSITLTDTTVSNNSANAVGGIYVFLADSLTASGLIVTGNSATVEAGGALFAVSNFASLMDSSFTRNTAGTELGGLGISRATLLNVKIEDNTAPSKPDCNFSVLSGSVTSLGGVGITDMTGCTGTFTAAPGDQIDNLLFNGGFEFAGASNAVPAGWTLKKITGDKRACSTPTKTISSYGKCAMQFKGGAGEAATITQSADLTGLTFTALEELRLYAMGDGSTATSKLKITLTASYSDQPANKAAITFSGNASALTAQSQILTLSSANVTKLSVKIVHTSPSGKFLLDRVYLTR
jgi:hypothetical protein